THTVYPPPPGNMLNNKKYYEDQYPASLAAKHFVFALIWTFGAALDDQSKPMFSEFVMELIAVEIKTDIGLDPEEADAIVNSLRNNDFIKEDPYRKLMISVSFPRDIKTLYDVVLNDSNGQWERWQVRVSVYKYNPQQPYEEIDVQTQDTVATTTMLDILNKAKANILVTGTSGSVNTIVVNDFLHIPTVQDISLFFQIKISAQSSAKGIQEVLEGRLTRRRSNLIGPSVGKQGIVFIDDMNIPTPEIYFAQPPIELIRQCVAQFGVYDRKKLTFICLTDTVFVSAFGPPGGGKQEKPSLPATVQQLAQPVVDTTVEKYQESYSTFLPTPSKSHYTFNLRDASSLASGVLHSSSGYQSSLILVKLQAHEGCLVFRAGACNDAIVIDDKDDIDMPPLSESFDIEEKPNELKVFQTNPKQANSIIFHFLECLQISSAIQKKSKNRKILFSKDTFSPHRIVNSANGIRNDKITSTNIASRIQMSFIQCLKSDEDQKDISINSEENIKKVGKINDKYHIFNKDNQLQQKPTKLTDKQDDYLPPSSTPPPQSQNSPPPSPTNTHPPPSPSNTPPININIPSIIKMRMKNKIKLMKPQKNIKLNFEEEAEEVDYDIKVENDDDDDDKVDEEEDVEEEEDDNDDDDDDKDDSVARDDEDDNTGNYLDDDQQFLSQQRISLVFLMRVIFSMHYVHLQLLKQIGSQSGEDVKLISNVKKRRRIDDDDKVDEEEDVEEEEDDNDDDDDDKDDSVARDDEDDNTGNY
ncbi:MAG: putative dynein heavy chain, partial [Streblomastix strix]